MNTETDNGQQVRSNALLGVKPVAWLHEVVHADDCEPDHALSFDKESFPFSDTLPFRSVKVTPLYAEPMPVSKSDVSRFTAVASKPHAVMAGDLADEIKSAIYRYADKIPLAIALGVLRIVEHEILNDA